MMRVSKQAGATLVVSLVMLIVLTLLVVAAIKSGSANLRIAGNTQVKTEANAAAQQAIEQVINTDFTSVPMAQTMTVNAGTANYTVEVSKPVCSNTVPIYSNDPSLNPSNEDDRLCFGDNPPVPVFGPDGKPLPTPATCNQQQWDVQADVTDGNTGVRVTQHQGISKRVYRSTSC